MLEPPVKVAIRTAVKSNRVATVGLGGDAATSDTAGGWISVSVAVKVANVTFSPVTLSTARASTCCGPEKPTVQRSCTMPSPPDIAAPANTLPPPETDRKSTRLNSSHLGISYAVFCLEKKKPQKQLSSSSLERT